MQDQINKNKGQEIHNKLRICHVIVSLNISGGAERMLMRLLNADHEPSNKKMVIVLCCAGVFKERLQSAGVIVHELGMKSFRNIPQIFLQLRKLIISFDPDIVQTWMYHADLLGGVAAYFSGYKNIIWGIRRTSLSLNDTISTLAVMKLCAILSFWIPKKIICVAEAGKKAHVAAGYNAFRMIVIPNGFDFSSLSATIEQRIEFRNKINIAEDELVIGCLARFHQAKGQDNFVKAAAIIVRNHTKIKFLMVGRGCDENNSKLINWLKDNNLKDYFVLLGEREDVPTCLFAMDIYCMPSRTEGFPNALGEAMAMALPCVATDVGDTKTLVGDTAILVPAQDENALARGLLDVMELSKEQRYKMGLNAKARVITEFSIDTACKRFNSVYLELISEGVS